jgi:hypothetical protein
MFISLNEINTFMATSVFSHTAQLDLSSHDLDLLFDQSFLSAPPAYLRTRLYDLSKPPNSYHEAIHRPDKGVWLAAMQREVDSLEERKAFERTSLPSGRKAIGVRWTYDFKHEPDGSIIRGKEKARLVAQGFSQRPEDFDETYAPVVKLTSVRVLLAFANHHDYDIMSFDVKTAFLHARLPYSIYVKQIPGYPEDDPKTVLHLLVALYGLKQPMSGTHCSRTFSPILVFFTAKLTTPFSLVVGPFHLIPLSPCLNPAVPSSSLCQFMLTMGSLSATPRPSTLGSSKQYQRGSTLYAWDPL